MTMKSICLQNSNLDRGASMDPVAQPASAVGKVPEQCCHSRASTNTRPILCDQTRRTKPPNAKGFNQACISTCLAQLGEQSPCSGLGLHLEAWRFQEATPLLPLDWAGSHPVGSTTAGGTGIFLGATFRSARSKCSWKRI